MSENFDVSVFFPIYDQLRAIRKPDFGRVVCKTYMLISSNLSSHKHQNRTKKSLTQLSCYCFD